MSENASEKLARENALLDGASKLYPLLELECEGRRAVCVGGHEADIDSINVNVGSEVILISEWVLERCLRLPGGTTNNPLEDRRLTLTKAHVVGYGNQHVHKTPLLQWCRDLCKANGVQNLPPGTPLLVFWWDMEHSKQDKTHTRGRTWWPSVYVPQYDTYGVWFSARVVEYDKKWASLQIAYDYNDPEELELGKVIVPLNFVHFGCTPPARGDMAQVFPPPWKLPAALVPCQQLPRGRVVVVQCPRESLTQQQGKPASTYQKQRVELVIKQHPAQLQSHHNQASTCANSQQQPRQQQQEPSSDIPALISLPPQPQLETSADIGGQVLIAPIEPAAAFEHQQQKRGGRLSGSQPKLKPEIAGVQGMSTDKPNSEAGTSRFTSSVASIHASALPVSNRPSINVPVKKPGASNGARTSPLTSNKRETWMLDDELEGDKNTGLGTTKLRVKRQKDGGGQDSQAIQAGQQQQAQPKQGKPVSAAIGSNLGNQQQQTPNFLGLPPRPSSWTAAAAVGTSGGPSVGVVRGTDTKHRHTCRQDMAKQQHSRPASTTGSDGLGQQGVHGVPATASTPAAAELTPVADSPKGSTKAAASSGPTASGLRAPKLSSLQPTASFDSKQVVQGFKQQKHHSPSLMKVAHQKAPNQQLSCPPSQPSQEQQLKPSRQRHQQAKQMKKQQQCSASLDFSTGNITSATNPVQAADCHAAAVNAAVGMATVPGLPTTTGAEVAGSALPQVDLGVGPTSRVVWPGNQRTGGAPKMDDLVLRPAAVQHCTLLSNAHVKAIAVAKGLLLGGSSESAADILERHLPQGGPHGQSPSSHPSPPPSAAKGSTAGGITMQLPGSLERPFQPPEQHPVETTSAAAPDDGAGTVAGPGQPAVATVAITMAAGMSAERAALTRVSRGLSGGVAADVSLVGGTARDDSDSYMAPVDETREANVLVSASTMAATESVSVTMEASAEVGQPVVFPVAAGGTGAVVLPVASVACLNSCSAPGGCAPASARVAPTLAGCLASLCDAMTHLSSVTGFISNPSPPLESHHHQQQLQLRSTGHSSQQQLLPPTASGKCVVTSNTVVAEAGGGGSDSAAFISAAGAAATGAASCSVATAAVTLSPYVQQRTPPSPSSADTGSDSDGEFAFVDNRQYVVALPPEERLAAYEALVPDRLACPTRLDRLLPAPPPGPPDLQPDRS